MKKAALGNLAVSIITGPANGTVPQPLGGEKAADRANSQKVGPPNGAQSDDTRARAAQHISAAFGGIVTVFMQTSGFQDYTLADLKWLVVPAIVTGQFSLVQARLKGSGDIRPVGVLLWASVSDSVDQRLSAEQGTASRLQGNEWRSGNILWIVEAVGERSIIANQIRKLRDSEWRGRPIKIKVRGKDGSPVIRQLPAA